MTHQTKPTHTYSLDKRYIQPQELRNWWHLVKPGLERIKEKSTEPWIPEDVYADCYEQRSMLWFFFVDNRPIGFVVLQIFENILHIWCAYGKCNLNDGFEHIKEIALSYKVKKISFDSSRNGWERQAPKLGFKPRRWVLDL